MFALRAVNIFTRIATTDSSEYLCRREPWPPLACGALNVGYFVALLSSSQNSLTAKYSLRKIFTKHKSNVFSANSVRQIFCPLL
jgi:hypothetical protein